MMSVYNFRVYIFLLVSIFCIGGCTSIVEKDIDNTIIDKLKDSFQLKPNNIKKSHLLIPNDFRYLLIQNSIIKPDFNIQLIIEIDSFLTKNGDKIYLINTEVDTLNYFNSLNPIVSIVLVNHNGKYYNLKIGSIDEEDIKINKKNHDNIIIDCYASTVEYYKYIMFKDGKFYCSKKFKNYEYNTNLVLNTKKHILNGDSVFYY